MAHAERLPWTVGPSLGVGLAGLALALVLLDGGLGDLTRLPVRRSAPAPTAPATPASDQVSPEVDDDAPPLPPRPDLAPERAPGGMPVSTPGKTVEDVCVEPRGATTGCTRWALDPFYAALYATERGTATAPVRLSWFGDSVSASDALPGRVRARLQDIFGDGGPGFVHAISPHRFNHNEAAQRSSTGSWRTWAVSLHNVADGLYGAGDSTAEGTGSIKVSSKTSSGQVSRVDVYYLAQPRGGTAELLVDGELQATIDTAAEHKQAGFAPLTLPDAAHTIELKTSGGKVRLFGVTLERDRGIVLDNMALVSATAKNLLENQADHWKSQLAHRAPDLVIIMLGTNEAQWLSGSDRSMAEYEQVWTKLLAPVRAARPGASCLVMAPLDQAEIRDDKLVARRGVPPMVDTQRKVAFAAGCGFWDTFTWMGGSGASIKWNKRGLLGSDFAHLSRKGTSSVADGLADALVAGYKAYKGR